MVCFGLPKSFSMWNLPTFYLLKLWYPIEGQKSIQNGGYCAIRDMLLIPALPAPAMV